MYGKLSFYLYLHKSTGTKLFVGLPVFFDVVCADTLLSVDNLPVLVMNIRDLRGRVPVLMDAEFLRVIHKALILSDNRLFF